MTDARAPDASDLLAHAGFVRGLARSILRDPDRADDVTQDTWVAALRRPPRAVSRVSVSRFSPDCPPCPAPPRSSPPESSS